jgi:hypothetical protein
MHQTKVSFPLYFIETNYNNTNHSKMIITNLIDSRSVHPCCFESFFISVVVVPIHRSQRRRKYDAFDDAGVLVDNRSEIATT